MQRILFLALVLVAGAAAADADHGTRQVRYIGVHPIPKSEGDGICYIEGPHVHIYGADKLQYRVHDGANYFVGDPVAYGWDGPRYAYKGHHPIQVEAVAGGDPDEEWCYIGGPHYHYFPAPDDPEFRLVGNAYFYVGTPPKTYVEARPAMMRINAVYAPLIYDRPIVEVDAPAGWIGARVDLPGVVVAAPSVVVERPRAVVVAPNVAIGAEVHLPLPSVHVGVGVIAPGVIVEERVKVKRGRHRGHWR
jgi:hypothetical protein